MSIRIEEINAQGLGPLGEFMEKMGDINLIYGPNEQGKTFLVEFLLKSLFKNTKEFLLRPGDPSGTVLVSGLDEGVQPFSPKSRQKLEDYWDKDFQGMPPNIARLLVVKGAKLNLDDKTTGGVSKAIIKSFLSSESTLDFIQEKIPKTIRGATIESGIIIGDKRGDLKKRNEIYRKLEDLDELLEKVDKEFSGGNRAALRHNIVHLGTQVEELLKAKRYRAYTIDTKIGKLKEELKQIEENGLDNLSNDFNDWDRLNNEQEKNIEDRDNAQDNSQHYIWLKTAIDEYEKMFVRGRVVTKKNFLFLAWISIIFSSLLLIGGLVLSLVLGHQIGIFASILGLLGVGVGILFSFLYVRQHQKFPTGFAENEEIIRISESFEEKFGIRLHDIATLKAQKEKIEGQYFKAQSLNNEIKDVELNIKNIKRNIETTLDRFGQHIQDEDSLPEIVSFLQKKRGQLKIDTNNLQVKLASLTVATDEYLEMNPGVEFNKSALKKNEEALSDTEYALHEEENELKTLDTEIRSTIGDKTSTGWDDLLENLCSKRHETAQAYRSLTSQILAGILVSKVVNDAWLQEDEKIKAYLSSQVVTDPLLKITGRYQAISLYEDRIKVADKFDQFEVDELSTGAREQVLLALRIGFVSKIMRQKTAFLILDDAFQHSDWGRRELCVEYLINLAKNGWQILYFSMDKHIQGLFDKIGKNTFGESYKSFDISK